MAIRREPTGRSLRKRPEQLLEALFEEGSLGESCPEHADFIGGPDPFQSAEQLAQEHAALPDEFGVRKAIDKMIAMIEQFHDVRELGWVGQVNLSRATLPIE